jgi:hypothetical protein
VSTGAAVTVTLSERELSCIRCAVHIIRGAERNYPDLSGVREGEATSDVLAALVARIDLRVRA